MSIHPTATVHPNAQLHSSVDVGPFAQIGANVTIGRGTTVGSHCHIDGHTNIGVNNRIAPFAALGCPPQDLKYSGDKTFLKIGNDNDIREFVTVNPATGIGNTTVIGDRNLLQAYVHIAHDCELGQRIVMGNHATLAGHVRVHDRAVIGDLSGVHQFCQIGRLAMVGTMTKITKDVPPFVAIEGHPARILGLNAAGLRDHDVPKSSISKLQRIYRIFYCGGRNVSQSLSLRWHLAEISDPFVLEFFSFVATSRRGVYLRTLRSRRRFGILQRSRDMLARAPATARPATAAAMPTHVTTTSHLD